MNRPANKLKRKLFLLAAAILVPYVCLMFILMITMLFDGASNATSIAHAIDVPYGYLSKAYNKAIQYNIEFAFLLTISAIEAEFNPEGFGDAVLERAVEKASASSPNNLDDTGMDIYNIYSLYYNDLKSGPLAKGLETVSKKEITIIVPGEINEDGSPVVKKETIIETTVEYYEYTSYNDFGETREYGGERPHQGNDLVAGKGTPVISITDGIVTEKGWNEFGGNIIGISTNRGTYFYYAHLAKYTEDLSEGDYVQAGEIIGYVGDTGYGPPGTYGKFIPHLHLQIGVKLDDKEEYFWISPYNIVKFLDRFRVMLRKEVQYQ